MAQVDGIGPVDGPRRILGDSLRRMAKVPRASDNPVDKVEISSEARDMAALARQERLQRIRTEIAQGTYETDEKWDIAIRRMIREIFEQGRETK